MEGKKFEPERHPVHHSYIWLGSLRVLGAVLVAMVVASLGSLPSVFAGFASGDSSERMASFVIAASICAIIVILGIVVVACHAWGYRHLYYTIGEEEFSLYSGIFSKKRMHIPYQRVQSVNHSASVLQRLAGVCTVKVETAGGAANEGATVPYVTIADAENLRLELFARKEAVLDGRPIPANVSAAGRVAQKRRQGAARREGAAAEHDVSRNVLDGADEILQDVRGIWGGMEVDTGHVTYEHGLSNRELVLAGLTNNAGFVLVAIGVVGTIAQVASGVLEILGGNAEGMADAALSVGMGFSPAVALFGIVVLLVPVLGLWTLSAVGSCLAYGGFRARRRDNRIEVEHGLLSRKFHGVDVDRVQSVIIRQGFIRRLMGYCEVSLGKVDSASKSNDDKEASSLRIGLVVHPFVKLDRVPEILAGLVPEFADVPMDNRPVASVALRRALVRRCTWAGGGFWLIVLAALCQAVLHIVLQTPEGAAEIGPAMGFVGPAFVVVYVVGVLWAVIAGVGAVLWYRESNFAFNRQFMMVTNGGFSRESVLVPRKKIQFGMAKSNPFQRAARVATVSVTTAAGLGTTLRLLDAREEDAAAWLSWLRPGGNR